MIVPFIFGKHPRTILRNVLFPAPFAPVIPIINPSGISTFAADNVKPLKLTDASCILISIFSMFFLTSTLFFCFSIYKTLFMYYYEYATLSYFSSYNICTNPIISSSPIPAFLLSFIKSSSRFSMFIICFSRRWPLFWQHT